MAYFDKIFPDHNHEIHFQNIFIQENCYFLQFYCYIILLFAIFLILALNECFAN